MEKNKYLNSIEASLNTIQNGRFIRTAIGVVLIILSSCASLKMRCSDEGLWLMKGEFWKKHVLNDLMPYWFEHVRDEEHGGFYMNLSRDWQPVPPWDKVPAMISRQIFSFSAAYLLSGEDKYLEAARKAVDYLLRYGLDNEYGGWFDSITQEGTPKDTRKNVPYQLYTNVGLTLYYFVTGDGQALSYILKSVEIHRKHAHDSVLDGYFQALNRDLSVSDSSKAKHSHYGYVGSLMTNLCLATRDNELLSFAEHMTDLSIEQMIDPEDGWILGYPTTFDRKWNYTPYLIDGKEMVHIGAGLTAALSFLRLYHQTGKASYLEHGKTLGDKINRYGWDADRGGWYDIVEKAHPYRLCASPVVSWWIQIYGSFLQLQLYNITRDEQYLKRFRKSEFFFNRYFMDRDYGGVFSSVAPDGSLVGDGSKASVWHTSYHEVEHGLLNYLYLNLYVNKRPVVLHFKLNGAGTPKKHYVSLVDDPSVQITGILINGKSWAAFDAQKRYVILPVGENLNVEVTLSPEPPSTPYLSDSNIPLHSVIATDDSITFQASPVRQQGRITVYIPWDSFSVHVDGQRRAIVQSRSLSSEVWTYDRAVRMLCIAVPPPEERELSSMIDFCIRKRK